MTVVELQASGVDGRPRSSSHRLVAIGLERAAVGVMAAAGTGGGGALMKFATPTRAAARDEGLFAVYPAIRVTRRQGCRADASRRSST